MHEALDALNLRKRTIVMQCEQHGEPETAMHRLVRESWNLDELEARYRSFVGLFQPILDTLTAADNLDALAALQIRLVLIHEYRKILLRDPQLPDVLLSSHWTGHDAYALCRELYAVLQPRSEQFVNDNFEAIGGKLPSPSAPFYQRFGGILESSKQGK